MGVYSRTVPPRTMKVADGKHVLGSGGRAKPGHDQEQTENFGHIGSLRLFMRDRRPGGVIFSVNLSKKKIQASQAGITVTLPTGLYRPPKDSSQESWASWW